MSTLGCSLDHGVQAATTVDHIDATGRTSGRTGAQDPRDSIAATRLLPEVDEEVVGGTTDGVDHDLQHRVRARSVPADAPRSARCPVAWPSRSGAADHRACTRSRRCGGPEVRSPIAHVVTRETRRSRRSHRTSSAMRRRARGADAGRRAHEARSRCVAPVARDATPASPVTGEGGLAGAVLEERWHADRGCPRCRRPRRTARCSSCEAVGERLGRGPRRSPAWPGAWAATGAGGQLGRRSASAGRAARRRARPRRPGRCAAPRRPSTWRPVRMRSLARAGPTRRGRRWVPPPPGMMPSRISGWPNTAALRRRCGSRRPAPARTRRRGRSR